MARSKMFAVAEWYFERLQYIIMAFERKCKNSNGERSKKKRTSLRLAFAISRRMNNEQIAHILLFPLHHACYEELLER